MANALAVIHEEDGIFGVSFPDFPGCITTARSLEEALRKGSEVLTFHVAGMVEDGLPLPAGSERADPDGGIVALIPYEVPGRAVRVNISIEETLLDQLDSAAKAAGSSRSAFLAEAVRQRLKASA